MTEQHQDLDSLLSQVREEQDQHLLDAQRRESVRRRLAIHEHTPRSEGWLTPPRMIGGSLAVAAVALLSFLGSSTQNQTPLAYAVEGQDQPTGEFLSTRADESMTLEFSEGSVVELAAETTARVEQLTSNGARLSLEHGVAEISVNHDTDTHWRIQSGPYAVHVVGTRFRVSWDATRREFGLQMHEGEVRVDGPFGQRSLRAGQSMHISPEESLPEKVPPQTARLVDTPAADSPDEVPSSAPSTQDNAAPPIARSPRRATDTTPGVPMWRQELQAGRADAALAAAGNISTLGASATLAELRALSTAARRSRSRLEPHLYRIIRNRFATSSDAADAAFLSGRRSQFAGRHGEAERWYRTYLAEAPSGRWAAEASGRRLEALHAQGRSEMASEWAERYLRRYPNGAHAPLARSLLPQE